MENDNMKVDNEPNDDKKNYAPDFIEIMEEMHSYESPNALFKYLKNTNWYDFFKFFLPLDINDRDNKIKYEANEIKQWINHRISSYENSFTDEQKNSDIDLIRSYSKYLNVLIRDYLEERGITYNKAKEERDKTIDILKEQLRQHINKNQIKPLLYDMKIDESEELKIKLKYTELGALIMWKTEIPHDLKSLDPNTLSLIDKKIKKYTKNLSNMHYVGRNQIKYNENIASELCLDILNNKGVPRCIQKHGKTELQIGPIEVGHGLLPSIYNEAQVHLTSDANNTGNFEFSQVRSKGLTNITGKTVSFLNIDAGSAPIQIGFQESMEEQEQLNKLKEDYKPTAELNKPIDITIYSPTDVTMLHIRSSQDDLTQYNIEIYSDNRENVHPIKTTITNLSRETVKEIVNSVKKEFQLNAALLKSLGDIIPYQTVCLQNALLNDVKDVNIMVSKDYSMIFQLLGNVNYLKDGKDVTCELNQRRILTGVNMKNSNVYFPWSSTEKHVYQLLFYINESDLEYIDNRNQDVNKFKDVAKIVSNKMYNYTHEQNQQKGLNFLMEQCIVDLTECAEVMNQNDNSTNFIKELEMSIKPLTTTTITSFEPENVTTHAANTRNDEHYSVHIDSLYYSLAYIIAGRRGEQLRKQQEKEQEQLKQLPQEQQSQHKRALTKKKPKSVKSYRSVKKKYTNPQNKITRKKYQPIRENDDTKI